MYFLDYYYYHDQVGDRFMLREIKRACKINNILPDILEDSITPEWYNILNENY